MASESDTSYSEDLPPAVQTTFTNSIEFSERLYRDSYQFTVESSTPTSISVTYGSLQTSNISQAQILLRNMSIATKEKLLAPIKDGSLDETTFLNLRDSSTGKLITVRAKDVIDLETNAHTENRRNSTDTGTNFNANENMTSGIHSFYYSEIENYSVISNTAQHSENNMRDSILPIRLQIALEEASGKTNSANGFVNLNIAHTSTDGRFTNTLKISSFPSSLLLPPPPSLTTPTLPAISETESGANKRTINTVERENDVPSSSSENEYANYDSSTALPCFPFSKFKVVFGCTSVLTIVFCMFIIYVMITDPLEVAKAAGNKDGDTAQTCTGQQQTHYTFVHLLFIIISFTSFLFLLCLSIASRFQKLTRVSVVRRLIGPTNSSRLIGFPYLFSSFAFFLLFNMAYDRSLQIFQAILACQLAAAVQHGLLLNIIGWSVLKALQIVEGLYAHRSIGKWLKKKQNTMRIQIAICIVAPVIIATLATLTSGVYNKKDTTCDCYISAKAVGIAVVMPMSLVACTGSVFVAFMVIKFMAERKERRLLFCDHSYKTQMNQFLQEIFAFHSMLITTTTPWILHWYAYEAINRTMFTLMIDIQGVLLFTTCLLCRYSHHSQSPTSD